MTSTPTTDDYSTVQTDLQRVAHHIATAADAHRRGLNTETLVALERAGVLVDSLGEVLEWWRFRITGKAAQPAVLVVEPEPAPESVPEPAAGPVQALPCDWEGCTVDPFATSQALASHKRKHARDQLRADAAAGAVGEPLPPRPEPEPDPPAPLQVVGDDPDGDEPHVGSVESVGPYEVRTIGRRRFLRCPDMMCGRRVILTDEQDQFEIADALNSHKLSGECLARAKSAAKR